MATHINLDDPRFRDAAAQILSRHDALQPEANITSAVRHFLVLTGLARNEEIIEENPPADSSRRAVDLTALDTFVEFKRRIGTASGGVPDQENVRQLDEYLELSAMKGRVRMGVLTDGKRWLLRWPGAGQVRLTLPYAFTLDDSDGWFNLYEWLRDTALVSLEDVVPDRDSIAEHFGPDSPAYQRDIETLRALYQGNAGLESIRVKRRLWYDLLRTALGEVAYSTEGMDSPLHDDTEEMDDLFVRHTYLSVVIGMVVQASFGIDIRRLAETEPTDLLHGRELYRATGLQGVLESDFFAWPGEVEGTPLLQTLARRVARFDWVSAPLDTAANLYQTVIPAAERRQLGEYYTPSWLARVMVRELVDDPLNQRVLDPACGSGTFVAEAVTHFIAAAEEAGWAPEDVLSRLRDVVTGIDVHPVAVHLARAAWILAAHPAIKAATAVRLDASMSIPIYLGDALQLRFRTGDMFAERTITIQTMDEDEPELVFPVSLVERAEDFDAFMGDVSAYIEEGTDPFLALDENHISDPEERSAVEGAVASLQRLHDLQRNHIWAYYTRNMVRPVALSRARVDVVIGNPPWINYNQTFDILRTELENLSRNRYGISGRGGRYATHQDVAGLFFARSVDLYLRDGGCHWVRVVSQRFAGRAVLKVAHRPLAHGQVWREYRGRLHPETGLGPGAAGTQHLLPGAGIGGVRPQVPAGYCRQAPGKPRGAVAGQYRHRGRAGGSPQASQTPEKVASRPTAVTPGRARSLSRAACFLLMRRVTLPSFRRLLPSPSILAGAARTKLHGRTWT